jgi:hypothetical protein
MSLIGDRSNCAPIQNFGNMDVLSKNPVEDFGQ